jgi:hypothetical protein
MLLLLLGILLIHSKQLIYEPNFAPRTLHYVPTGQRLGAVTDAGRVVVSSHDDRAVTLACADAVLGEHGIDERPVKNGALLSLLLSFTSAHALHGMASSCVTLST